MIVFEKGIIFELKRHEPYGATAGGTNPTGVDYTGLVYMQQRYVDPDGMGKRDSVCGGY